MCYDAKSSARVTAATSELPSPPWVLIVAHAASDMGVSSARPRVPSRLVGGGVDMLKGMVVVGEDGVTSVNVSCVPRKCSVGRAG